MNDRQLGRGVACLLVVGMSGCSILMIPIQLLMGLLKGIVGLVGQLAPLAAAAALVAAPVEAPPAAGQPAPQREAVAQLETPEQVEAALEGLTEDEAPLTAEQVAAWAAARGADEVIVIPADQPLTRAQRERLRALLASGAVRVGNVAELTEPERWRALERELAREQRQLTLEVGPR